MNSITRLFQTTLFWWTVFVLPLFSMLIALFYQYALEELPCAICIHIRIYMIGLMLVGLLGVVWHALIWRVLLHWLCAGFAVGLAVACWQLFGVEKGFIISSCSIGADLPAWLPLDSWLPLLFDAQGICGMSPHMLMGLSMADLLMVASIAGALVAICAAVTMTLAQFRR